MTQWTTTFSLDEQFIRNVNNFPRTKPTFSRGLRHHVISIKSGKTCQLSLLFVGGKIDTERERGREREREKERERERERERGNKRMENKFDRTILPVFLFSICVLRFFFFFFFFFFFQLTFPCTITHTLTHTHTPKHTHKLTQTHTSDFKSYSQAEFHVDKY